MTVKDTRAEFSPVIDFYVGVDVSKGLGIIAHHLQGNRRMLVDAGVLETCIDCQPILHACLGARGLMDAYCNARSAVPGETVMCIERLFLPREAGKTGSRRRDNQRDRATAQEIFRMQELSGMWRTCGICALQWTVLDEDDTHRGVGANRWRWDLWGKGKGRPRSAKEWDLWTRGYIAQVYGRTFGKNEQHAVDALCVATWAAERYAHARQLNKLARAAEREGKK